MGHYPYLMSTWTPYGDSYIFMKIAKSYKLWLALFSVDLQTKTFKVFAEDFTYQRFIIAILGYTIYHNRLLSVT